MKLLFIIILILLASFATALWVSNKKVPENLGVKDGKLSPCPSKPNCVSSQSTSPDHYIKPLDVSDIDNPLKRIKAIVMRIPKTTIVSEDSDYLYVTFRSKTFSFVDDTEFYYDRDKKEVHVRSAARAGYSDLGVNRKRIEWIRNQLPNDT